VFFLVTIGEDVDHITRRMQRAGRVFESSLFDSVCSFLADDLAARVQREVAARYEGLHPSYRFSPGYCDWDLEEQVKIFSVFPKRGAGIELNGSCAMSPRKSVSGIFGLGPELRDDAVPCRVCRDSDCSYRREVGDESFRAS
jgi:cobalamin-dependent methionine synthase I